MPVMKARSENGCRLNVFHDTGATLSLITFEKAHELGLRGESEVLNLVKVGGVGDEIMSMRYEVTLLDGRGVKVTFVMYGIDVITKGLSHIYMNHYDTNWNLNLEMKTEYCRVDVLLGFNYAEFNPVIVERRGHLTLFENRFGFCVGSSNESIGTNSITNVIGILQTEAYNTDPLETFFLTEEMGVSCTPKCGGCKCGKCQVGSGNYTLKEERELRSIEEGLEFIEGRWIAKYPWIKDPYSLPDNKFVVEAMLKSTEERLLKNSEMAAVYQKQIEDMLERGVARKLQVEELYAKGPRYYVSHHEVLKEGSSTPCRIVFNSSFKYKGYSLNDYWAKGPDMLNSLIGILLRFRQFFYCICNDVSKMYHSVHIGG